MSRTKPSPTPADTEYQARARRWAQEMRSLRVVAVMVVWGAEALA